MAEALAVVSIVSNIVQLADFGTKVLRRLHNFQKSLGQIPKAFQHVKAELPILLQTLKETKSAVQNGNTNRDTRKAILHVVQGCQEQISQLDQLLEKVIPKKRDSWIRITSKAFTSLRQDSKVAKITHNLRTHIQSLTSYQIAVLSRRPLRRESPSSQPSPSSTVPFRRDRDFVYRDILSEIHVKCSQPASRVALVGLGGVGKSQLAIEYSYRTREESPETWVFWIYATNRARFEESYQCIAERVKMPGWDRSDVDILRIVTTWLQDESNGKWLLIVDNADDRSLFSSSGDVTGDHNPQEDGRVECLSKYLPQSQHGAILVTSRSQNVALKITGNSKDIIVINPMDEKQAMDLLCSNLQASYIKQDAKTLIKALDYMPLAISQAAAFINQRTPFMNVSKYLKDLQRSDADRFQLLNNSLTDNRRDGKSLNSIMATWQISFENIRREKPSAARLLSLMSLFDRQGIPKSLLITYHLRRVKDNQIQEVKEEVDEVKELEEDMYTLCSYSLIGTNLDGTEFEMHRLVQFAMRTWLELNDELESFKEQFIKLMDAECPTGKYENWETWQKLFPHAQELLTYRLSKKKYVSRWAGILAEAAWYACQKGNYTVAEKLVKEAMAQCDRVLGPEYSSHLDLMIILSGVYNYQGRMKESKELSERTVDASMRIYGEEHSVTLGCKGNLALIYQTQGQLDHAEELQKQVLESSLKVFGEEHPVILNKMHNLSITYRKQCRWSEAEELQRKELEICAKVRGEEHPDVCSSMENLAVIWKRLGRKKDAIELLQKAVTMYKKTLGPDHPHTLGAIEDLRHWRAEVKS